MKYLVTSTIAIALLGLPALTSAQSCALTPGQAYKTPSTNAVWYISDDCAKRAILNPDVFFSHFDSWNDVQSVSDSQLGSVPNHELGFLPWGTRREYKNGSLLKTVDDPKVYVVLDGERYPIESEQAFQDLGYRFDQIEDVFPQVLDARSEGHAINGVSDYPANLIFSIGGSNDLYLMERDESGAFAKVRIEDFGDVQSAYRTDRIASLPAGTTIYDSARASLPRGTNLRSVGRVAQVTPNTAPSTPTPDPIPTPVPSPDPVPTPEPTPTPQPDPTPEPVPTTPSIVTRGADIAGLSDEFSDSSSLGNWQRAYQAESWGFDQLEEYAVSGGQLTMVPYASSWYQDYRGVHVYKPVTGDFIATTRLSVRNRAGNGAPGTLYSLAGIFIREPRNTTPSTWSYGGENYVFLSLGAADQPGNYQTEVKTTLNSDSQLEIAPAAGGDATIRMVRIGGHIITMIQPDGGSWRVHRRYDRPDFSTIINVGLTTYTDWPAAERRSVEEHNQNLITDGAPDLRADIDYYRFARPSLPEDVYTRLENDPWGVSDSELLQYFAS